jgi:hypothetical protein
LTGLHTPIAGCEMDRPRKLMLLYDALDQLRASIAAA